MKAFIYSNKLLIGTTDFRNQFGSMGHIWGNFYPNEDYETIRPQVQAFLLSDNRNLNDWLALRFNVQLENGHFIFPVGGYDLSDFPDFPDERMEIHLAGVDFHIYFDYFENEKTFLYDPWSRITIEEKNDIEESTHVKICFNETSFSALARNEVNNSVLFSINGRDSNSFAVIDFDIDNKICSTNYFLDFADFIERRMVQDGLKRPDS
jgi:hypothetical protein